MVVEPLQETFKGSFGWWNRHRVSPIVGTSISPVVLIVLIVPFTLAAIVVLVTGAITTVTGIPIFPAPTTASAYW